MTRVIDFDCHNTARSSEDWPNWSATMVLAPFRGPCDVSDDCSLSTEGVHSSPIMHRTKIYWHNENTAGNAGLWLLPNVQMLSSEPDIYERILEEDCDATNSATASYSACYSIAQRHLSGGATPGTPQLVKHLSAEPLAATIHLASVLPAPWLGTPAGASSHRLSCANIVRAHRPYTCTQPFASARSPNMLAFGLGHDAKVNCTRDGIADLLTAAQYTSAAEHAGRPSEDSTLQALSHGTSNLVSVITVPCGTCSSLPALAAVATSRRHSMYGDAKPCAPKTAAAKPAPVSVRPRSSDSSVQQSDGSLPSRNICTVCNTDETSLWRRKNGALVCNACALYEKLHGHQRPVQLLHQPIRRRNRTVVKDTQRNRRGQRSQAVKADLV